MAKPKKKRKKKAKTGGFMYSGTRVKAKRKSARRMTIPLNILEKRLVKLNRIVKKRGGDSL